MRPIINDITQLSTGNYRITGRYLGDANNPATVRMAKPGKSYVVASYNWQTTDPNDPDALQTIDFTVPSDFVYGNYQVSVTVYSITSLSVAYSFA